MTSDQWPLWGILIFLLLTAVNAFFVASVRAMSSVNKISLRELADEGNDNAKKVLPVIDNLSDHEISLRSFSILTHMFGIFIMLYAYMPALEELVGYRWIAFVIIFLISGLLMFALGEVYPRRLAILHDEGIALSTSGVVKFLSVVMKPMTLCVKGIAVAALLITRQRTDVEDNEYSEEDIVEMLEAGQESGELKEEGKKMITGVFAFDDILAYEIMTPRTDVFAIDINDPPEEYMDELMELRYSRIPVYEDDSDNIIGILYIKDYLIKAREDGFDNVDIHPILRKPYFVPETKNIDSLFFELQKTKQHIAILIDEYGGFCGIVTMEDIIEEVMGDIDDEYDEVEQEIRKIGEDLYLIDGSTDIDDIDEELDIDLESENSETIGGLIIDMFGEIPDEDDIGKEIFYENYVFTIKSVKDRRIEQVMMKILKDESNDG
ncbi:MAG: hemolysin family protein [Bacillota bacterium]|nr:hemolysin family protein [Bacillota bacterium]